MAWSANELKPPDLSGFLTAFQSDQDAARVFAGRMAEQMRIITEALQPLAELDDNQSPYLLPHVRCAAWRKRWMT